MFPSYLSRIGPPSQVTLDNHTLPSPIGSPPGASLHANYACVLASRNSKTTTAKKEKKTAREEKKMAAEKKKKRRSRFESDSETTTSSENKRDKRRLQSVIDARVEAEAKEQEGSSASSGAEIPLYVEVNQGQRFPYLRR